MWYIKNNVLYQVKLIKISNYIFDFFNILDKFLSYINKMSTKKLIIKLKKYIILLIIKLNWSLIKKLLFLI